MPRKIDSPPPSLPTSPLLVIPELNPYDDVLPAPDNNHFRSDIFEPCSSEPTDRVSVPEAPTIPENIQLYACFSETEVQDICNDPKYITIMKQVAKLNQSPLQNPCHAFYRNGQPETLERSLRTLALAGSINIYSSDNFFQNSDHRNAWIFSLEDLSNWWDSEEAYRLL